MTAKTARSVKITIGIFLSLGLSLALLGQNAQEIYQRALVQEQAAGNLKQAIELYSQAAKAAGKDRALAAKALTRIAGIREKLGQQSEAAEIYAEAIRTYPEQREQAQLAQSRLDAIRQTLPATLTDVSAVMDPLFETYCIKCHGAAGKSGGLDLNVLNTKNLNEHTPVWEKVLRRLRARQEPPSGLPRPDDKTYRAAIARLEAALDRAYPSNGPSQTAARVTDTQLAGRIAAFIWGGAPDAPLLEDAQRGKLQDPAVLGRQVRRMLRDPKSSYLVAGFFTQWLSLDKLKKAEPDPALFPQFDSELLQAMATETRLFLESQLHEDRGALELWTANYTFLNERMARHYGIPRVSGKEFRKVTWPDNTRAGLLGQAGPLTLLSFASRTSPIVRGLYVLTNFLGVDPLAPPPNVPPLQDGADDRSLPMRDRMAAHTRNPLCASCHVHFDPLGLALENFNAIGQWRIMEGGTPIDVSGAFIDGTRFRNPVEFRNGLLKYRDAYYSNVTQQLLGHALGRKGRRLYDYEMPAVRAIVQSAGPKDYRWSSIISGIVAGAPFQMKNIVP